jgi:parvulin-like peptidyl-prolyl isomerase
MTPVLQVDDRNLKTDEIIPLLKRYGILPQLVREMILEQILDKFVLTQEETMQAYKLFYQEHQLHSEVELQAWLVAHGLEREHLDYLAIRKVKLESFKRTTWKDKLKPYFIQRKAKLDQVIYSLIRVKDVGLAQELYFRIQEKEQSFGELASKYSQGAEAYTGGVLGPIELGATHPLLANLLTSAQPHQLLPPTRLGEWIVIVRLEKLLPATLNEIMQQRLMNELFESWLKAQITASLHA